MKPCNYKYIFLLVAFLISAIGSATETVTIAVMSEKPGLDIDSPSYLPLIKDITQFAVDKRRAEFSRAGINLQIKHYFQDPPGPLAAYDTLATVIKSDAVAAVGFQSSDEVVTASPLIENLEFVAVTPFATSTAILPMYPHFQMLSASNAELVEVLENIIDEDLKPKRMVAIVAWDSPYAKNVFETLSVATKSRMKLFKIRDNMEGFESVIPDILRENPDLVFLPNFPVTTASVIKFLATAGFKGIFLGPDSWGEGADERFLKITGSTPFTGYTVRQYVNLFEGDNKKFSNTVKRLFKTKISTVPVLYYDATNYVLDTLLKTPRPISRRGFYKTSQSNRESKGLAGWNCLSKLSCKNRTFSVMSVSEKGFKFLKRIGAQSGK